MKKLYFLFILLSSATGSIKAQVWAPNIGSYWNYTIPYHQVGMDYYSGYKEYKYVKDSLVNGNNCQMLSRYVYQAWHVAADQDYYESPVFTYTNSSGVVFINNYKSTGSVQGQTFDTLYRFNVPIGTKWMFPHYCASGPVITVLDTGHRQIQNVNLKWQKVSYHMMFGGDVYSPALDTIYERFGFLQTNPLNPGTGCLFNDENPLNFRCYGDNQINGFKYGHNNPCNFVLGVNDRDKDAHDLSVFPNPASSYICFNYTNPKWQEAGIDIQDALGRIVLQQSFSAKLDLGSLVPGIYIVTVKNDSALRSFKIMKE